MRRLGGGRADGSAGLGSGAGLMCVDWAIFVNHTYRVGAGSSIFLCCFAGGLRGEGRARRRVYLCRAPSSSLRATTERADRACSVGLLGEFLGEFLIADGSNRRVRRRTSTRTRGTCRWRRPRVSRAWRSPYRPAQSRDRDPSPRLSRPRVHAGRD